MKKRMTKAGCLLCAALMTASLLTGCRGLRDKDSELAYRQKGISAMALGKYEDAVNYFQKALDQSVGGVHDLEKDICLYKAEALYLMGDIDAAEELYSALIAYDDDMADAYYLRGNLLFSTGDREAGQADFDRAIEKDKNNIDLYISIYETMAKYGMGETAENYLQTALEVKGEDALTLSRKGRIFYFLGDYQSAMEILAEAVGKGSKEANLYLTQVYAAVGDLDESDRYFTAYMESGAADAQQLLAVGENRLNAGDYKLALKYLKGALELDTIQDVGRQQLLRDMIAAYEYNRNYQQAYELCQIYVKDYPNDFAAEKELTFLKTRCEEPKEPPTQEGE